MTLRDKLEHIKTVLVTICPDNCYHYFRTGMAVPYCVWAEDMEPSTSGLNGDNIKVDQIIHGLIDYFTKKEFDPVIDEINDALNRDDQIASFISMVDYEDDTKTIHYQWEFEV